RILFLNVAVNCHRFLHQWPFNFPKDQTNGSCDKRVEVACAYLIIAGIMFSLYFIWLRTAKEKVQSGTKEDILGDSSEYMLVDWLEDGGRILPIQRFQDLFRRQSYMSSVVMISCENIRVVFNVITNGGSNVATLITLGDL
ncbi:uncharacterized protein Bfra_007062, partial [Botrytis fragariae]